MTAWTGYTCGLFYECCLNQVKTFMLLFMLVWLHFLACPTPALPGMWNTSAPEASRGVSLSLCIWEQIRNIYIKQGLLASQPNIILNHCLFSSGGCYDHKHKALWGEFAHADVTSTPLRSPYCASKLLEAGVLVLQGMLGCVDLFLRSLLIHAGY